jgi:hypothetical protein
VRYLVRCGNFEKAFQVFKSVEDMQTRWNIFFDGIFRPAVEFRYLKRLTYRLRSDLELFGGYFEKLLRIAIDHDTSYLVCEVEKMLGRRDLATEAAVRLMLAAESTVRALGYCAEAKRTCEEALRLPSADVASLQRYHVLLELQTKFLHFCKSRGFEWSRLSVFGDASVMESMVTFLFMNLQCGLGVEVMKTCGVSVVMVARRVTDILANEDDCRVVGFLLEFGRATDERIFQGVVHEMVVRWMDGGFGEEKLFFAIKNGITDGEFKCLVMLELGNLEEAMLIAKKAKNGELFGVSGNAAYRTGWYELAGEAQKELSRFG